MYLFCHRLQSQAVTRTLNVVIIVHIRGHEQAQSITEVIIQFQEIAINFRKYLSPFQDFCFEFSMSFYLTIIHPVHSAFKFQFHQVYCTHNEIFGAVIQ